MGLFCSIGRLVCVVGSSGRCAVGSSGWLVCALGSIGARRRGLLLIGHVSRAGRLGSESPGSCRTEWSVFAGELAPPTIERPVTAAEPVELDVEGVDARIDWENRVHPRISARM